MNITHATFGHDSFLAGYRAQSEILRTALLSLVVLTSKMRMITLNEWVGLINCPTFLGMPGAYPTATAFEN